jgi:hypothetical protein
MAFKITVINRKLEKYRGHYTHFKFGPQNPMGNYYYMFIHLFMNPIAVGPMPLDVECWCDF